MNTVGAEIRLDVLYPDALGWENARQAWNLAVDQRPEAVVFPESAADVVAAIELARERGWRLAPQGTGHGAAGIGSLEGTLLLKTERMRRVTIDPVTRIARVEAGTLWEDVVRLAAHHGLAALAGSAPDVGVVGYTLGGGLSWLGRKHGLAANSVVAAELVTPDGRTLRIDHDHEPDLFWAVRGGGGGFGVVTALEFRLFPLSEVYAGILWWPIERATQVLQAWRSLTEGALPDELTTVGRLLRLPPILEVPEPLRGKSFVVVQVIHLGEAAEAEALLAPLRALEPAIDTLRRMPVAELSRLHMDPEEPVPAVGDGVLLGPLSPEAITELVRVAGARSSSQLVSVELRQLGGELARDRSGSGALASLDAAYALYAIGFAPTPTLAATAREHVAAVQKALAPWAARHMYLNFAETRCDPATLWSDQAHRRLLEIKSTVDPTNLLRANHPVVLESRR